MVDKVFGYDWVNIQRAQQGGSLSRRLDLSKPGDWGADPIGDGLFRMVPSGDVVDYTERCKRLGQTP